MTVHHEKFGVGDILKSTEQFDEAGNIVSADVLFEHGIEQGLQLEEIKDLDEKLTGNQHKLDANKNGKVDAEDFKKLRGKKNDKDESEESEESEESDDKDDEKDDKKNMKFDKNNMKESIIEPAQVTPDSAAMRMPAVESVVRDIMSQQRNLRQEAKIADFKSRNK